MQIVQQEQKAGNLPVGSFRQLWEKAGKTLWDLKGYSLCTCFEHILHRLKKFQTKVFLFHIFTQVQSDIHSMLFKFWPRVKKMHLNFGTCPPRQEAGPNSKWDRYPRTKGLGKSGKVERILQFMNLVQWACEADTFTTEITVHLTGTCPFHHLLCLLLSHAALCNRLE